MRLELSYFTDGERNPEHARGSLPSPDSPPWIVSKICQGKTSPEPTESSSLPMPFTGQQKLTTEDVRESPALGPAVPLKEAAELQWQLLAVSVQPQ